MARQQITGELFDYDWKKQRYGGKGRTLGSFLAETTDGVLALETPQDDAIQRVSLAPFADKNPDHFLVFTFIESDNGFDDLDHGNAVVLAEYELPPGTETPRRTMPPAAGDSELLKQYQLPPGAKMIEVETRGTDRI